TPTPPASLAPARTPSNFFTSTGTYSPPRLPPPLESRSPWEDDGGAHPWPRMPPPLRAFSPPPVQAAHRVETVPVLDADDGPSSPNLLPTITDDFPRAVLKTYEGPHPFWVKPATGTVFGPIGHKEAIEALRAEARRGKIESAAISATSQRWMDAATFCVLSGQ